MLRSLYSGISGLRSHQTMLDTTGNNIANVNTTGFKSSRTQFQDTLSQLAQGATGAAVDLGGRNPAQIGLGVQVAGITTNFTQGAAQTTGRNTDMMVSGDGFFVLRKGNQEILSRAGSFDFDARGRLVSPDGGIVQGRMAVNGVVPASGALQDITLPVGLTVPGTPTSSAVLSGNLPREAAVGETRTLDREVFAADGTPSDLVVKFTRTASGWAATGTRGGSSSTTQLTQNANGTLSGGPLTVGGITVDLSDLTGYADVDTASIVSQNGTGAGSLESYTLGADGTLNGRFSNGALQPIARMVLGTVTNPSGLEKTGSSGYVTTANSGVVDYSNPGDAGAGTVAGGMIEMSNVDLSQEFTNLIVAQRGFQANARIITTSDEVLQELTNLKR